MTSREEELVARELLEHPGRVGIRFQQKRWAELAALVRFARREVPPELAQTDPALYRRLRAQITRFFLLGGDAFSLEALEARSRVAPSPPTRSRTPPVRVRRDQLRDQRPHPDPDLPGHEP